jgi:hypothetical protein
MNGVLDELPIRYRVKAQLAHDHDQTTDPGRAWPADRERVDLSTVVITGPDTEREPGAGDRRHRALGRSRPAHPYPRLRGVGAPPHRRRTSRDLMTGQACSTGSTSR